LRAGNSQVNSQVDAQVNVQVDVQVNAEIGRAVYIYRKSELRFTLEAFNAFHHPFLNSPSATMRSNGNHSVSPYCETIARNRRIAGI